MKIYIWGVIPFLLIMACNRNHEEPHSHDDSGHSEAQLSIDTTIHTGKVELFVEYPALIVGHTSKFAAHFTELEEHKPVLEGSVTVSLIKGKKGIRHTVNEPSSPGIFTPALQAKEAGNYHLFIELNAGELKERIDMGMVRVFADEQSAEEALSGRKESEPEISFTKEQAWKMDFKTAPVQKDTIYGLIKLAGRWMPVPGDERTLNAGSSGNVTFETPGLVEGIEVKKDQVLMRISGENINSGSLETKIVKAKAEFEQAKNIYERKKELHDLKVVPDSEFEEAVKNYEIARSDYQQLLKNYGNNGVVIRAPMDGYLKHIKVENGSFVNAGEPLLTIGADLRSMIKADASPDKRNLISQTKKMWVIQQGKSIPVKGRIISLGKTVNGDNPLIPVYIEVNSLLNTLEGGFAEIHLGYSGGETGLIIPRSALLEDFGTYKVIVQTGGEGFETRSVKVGAVNGGLVTITEGLRENEWIVVTGAYQVKMASMAGAPAHGHAH